MPKFSKTTLKFLYQAGWFEKRKVNISEFIPVLHEEGFSLTKKVAQFLKSFGKLKIKQPGGDYFHFDVIEATLSVDTDWVKQDYSERVGEKLCIIGEAFNGYMTLCMSPQGEVYAGFDDTLVYVGTSGYDAIEALSLGYELAKVPELAPELITHFKESIDEYVEKYVKAQFEHIQELMNQQKFSQVLRQGWGNVFKQRFENAVIVRKYSPKSTLKCLEKMLEEDITFSNGSGIVVVIGLHPKYDMKKSEIKNYMISTGKKQGVFLNRENIETRYIPETQYALTAFIEKASIVSV